MGGTSKVLAIAMGMAFVAMGAAHAAAPDWSKVPAKQITASTRAPRRWNGS